MRTRFTITEEKVMRRIQSLRELIEEAELHDGPCPLLDEQLRDLQITVSALHGQLSDLQEMLKT